METLQSAANPEQYFWNCLSFAFFSDQDKIRQGQPEKPLHLNKETLYTEHTSSWWHNVLSGCATLQEHSFSMLTDYVIIVLLYDNNNKW